MKASTVNESSDLSAWSNYFALCKPRVVALIVFTAIIGMFLSVPYMVPLQPLLFGTIGIGLAAASAAAFNHYLDRNADAHMGRTRRRPLPTGQLNGRQVIVFASALGIVSMLILVLFVNTLTAVLTFFSLIGYALIYTVYLKHATPQNIVIGGAAGAAPPVLGWCAVTGTVDPHALLLFLIVFVWTPPHFWALAVAKQKEYANADIPMLPVTHGADFTRLHIVFYTILLILVTLLPYLTHMSGIFYLVCALALDSVFLYYSIVLLKTRDDRIAMKTFGYSIVYLMALFAVLLVDHFL